MIEQEDLLGEECRKVLNRIRSRYQLLQEKVKIREVMFRYDMEMMLNE